MLIKENMCYLTKTTCLYLMPFIEENSLHKRSVNMEITLEWFEFPYNSEDDVMWTSSSKKNCIAQNGSNFRVVMGFFFKAILTVNFSFQAWNIWQGSASEEPVFMLSASVLMLLLLYRTVSSEGTTKRLYLLKFLTDATDKFVEGCDSNVEE